MFKSLLIANRGEIGCRVIRTARALGIRTVAVYSQADTHAAHVAMADEAYCIGPAPAAESYLCAEKIVEVARRAGAEAVHPGYGFLSENAAFADLCTAAGIVFVGPPSHSIRAMGLKDSAKALMEKAGVPIVPGYHGDNQDPDALAARAGEIGYPVLIKAVAGGGGKGMRRADSAADFSAALGAARREAKSSFGDERVLVEKFIARPRHIEIQIFADSRGNAASLFERDCSVQRRHQKVLEEAPAPGISSDMRRVMGEAAVAAAKAVGYIGAGTIEFIADASEGLRADRFYFMEMNTRLQVEHPVTEMVTGLDLVEWQLRVAAGQALPKTADELSMTGHAVEARLYAEDPHNNFFPSPGTLHHLHLPPESAHLRVDTGVRRGDEVTLHYDPMIAKIIAVADTRADALRRLAAAMREVEIVGVRTNAAFVARLATHPAFQAGDFDTGFIESHANDLIREDEIAHEIAAVAVAAPYLAAPPAKGPFGVRDGWRLHGSPPAETPVKLSLQGRPFVGTVRFGEEVIAVSVEDETFFLALDRRDPGSVRIGIHRDGMNPFPGRIIRHGRDVSVICRGTTYACTYESALETEGVGRGAAGAIVAPLTGKVLSVHARPGERVKGGQALVVMEAMKMEHTLAAEAEGVVERVLVAEGEQVRDGQTILTFEDAEG